MPLTGTEAPALPPWPTSHAHALDDADALRDQVLALHGEAPAAVGLFIGPDPTRGRHDADDWRGGCPGAVALAVPATEGSEARVWTIDTTLDPEPLLAWLADPSGPYVVTHGAQLTVHRLLTWAGRDDAPTPLRLGCTQVAAVLLASGHRRGLPSLPDCVERALEHAWPFESPALPLTGDDPRVVAATSAAVLVPLMRALTPMLRRRDLARVYDLECHLVPAVVAMERAGVGVDAAGFQRIVDGWLREQPTATDPERQARLAKLVSTYGYWPREYVSGDRIHCRLHPLAADSGRFSCTEPNLQQVPSEHVAPGLRACFRAAPGHVLVVADYAQIELRVAAHLAPCDAMRAVFREGRDPHRATAATLTGKPEAEVSTRERQLAKAVNFGFLFGMGAPRFRSYAMDSYGVELDMQEAQRAREAFLRTFPGIAAWHARVGRLGRQHPPRAVTVRTALGRRRRFDAERFSFNAALNIPVQGTAADGFKLAMTRLLPRLRALGGRGILCVHDEYLAEVPQERAEEGRAVVEQTLREAMQEIVTTVPIEVEAAVVESWADK
ncbi:DNA polymerase [Paraliomyxa miuraensis]|uniref:DNA polymerase n=1 Tax=Paraliomyxa miuraensis TaxID=376150 RepID=UPI0022574DBF|nr:DNA polymerase [Paraliomyxa miuraensis]MCX4242260.1 DNA polymerase [Paraliomyxa miuraensis]